MWRRRLRRLLPPPPWPPRAEDMPPGQPCLGRVHQEGGVGEQKEKTAAQGEACREVEKLRPCCWRVWSCDDGVGPLPASHRDGNCGFHFLQRLPCLLRPPEWEGWGVLPYHCTMCILASMFTFQPNKMRHILKDASWKIIQHIFVSACSVGR